MVATMIEVAVAVAVVVVTIDTNLLTFILRQSIIHFKCTLHAFTVRSKIAKRYDVWHGDLQYRTL